MGGNSRNVPPSLSFLLGGAVLSWAIRPRGVLIDQSETQKRDSCSRAANPGQPVAKSDQRSQVTVMQITDKALESIDD